MTHALQARPIVTRHFADTETSYFTVFVGDEVFGLPVRKTQTIFRIGSITTVPGGPSDIAGLVNLRGKIVTAVSLRRRLRIPCDVPFANALAITIEHKGECFGLIVDRVGDVLTLDPSKQIPVPPHFDAERLRLTQGLYRLENLLVPVLDIDAVFDFAT
jgi:purine-binding chemotaxis protein CheW